MNERGKRLTLSDLVKNLCFRKMQGLGDELLDEFEDDWDKVELLVSDFGLFLWHAWVSRYGTCQEEGIQGTRETHKEHESKRSLGVFLQR